MPILKNFTGPKRLPEYIRIGLVFAILTTASFAQAESPVDMVFRDQQGKKVTLSDHRDQIVVLNFWATWCPHCRAEKPLVVQAHREYASKGVEFIGISLDDRSTRKQIPEYAKKHEIAFPIWFGTPKDLGKLNLGESIPATVFIDRDGKVVGRILGRLRENDIQERLDWLLGDRTTPAPEALVSYLGN